MNQRGPYQLFILENSQPYPQLQDLQSELLLKYPTINIRRINRLSSINPSTVNQQTMILVLSKLLPIDNQIQNQLLHLIQNRAKVIMYPLNPISDLRIQVATLRVGIVNEIGKWYAGNNQPLTNSLTNTRSLSDMGNLSRQPYNLVMYYRSKNKNFNSLMNTLAIKYKNTPTEIRQISDLNQVRRVPDVKILIVCSWEAKQLQALVKIVKNQSANITTIMFVTERQTNQQIAELYDFCTSEFNEIQYLVDYSSGRLQSSNYRNSSSVNSSRLYSVHRSKQVVTTSIQPPVQQIHYKAENFPNLRPQMNPQIVQSMDVPIVAPVLPVSPVKALDFSSQQNPMIQNNINDQIGQKIAYSARPQSDYLPNQPYNPLIGVQTSQMNILPPTVYNSPQRVQIPGGGPRIQMLSAKKRIGEFIAPNIQQRLIVVDDGTNESYGAFYRPIVGSSQIINQLPNELQFQNPTIILIPYEWRNRLYNINQQNVRNVNFIMYAPRLIPDPVVSHPLVQLTTKSPAQLVLYLQSKNIIPKELRPSSATSIGNSIAMGAISSMGASPTGPISNAPRMSKVNSNMGAKSVEMMWITKPIGPGDFITISGQQASSLQPINRNLYRDQQIVPILNNPERGMNPPMLRGAAGVFENSQVYKPYQSRVNALDELSKLMIGGRIQGLSPMHIPNHSQQTFMMSDQRINQQLTPPAYINNQLNESSQLEQIVISPRKEMLNSVLPGNALIFPSGIQRQGALSPGQPPLVIDQHNIASMNSPIQMMPIVPESKFSNISSQTSKRHTGTFNNFHHPQEQSIHYYAQSNQMKNPMNGFTTSQHSRQFLAETFGTNNVQQHLLNGTPRFSHPSQVPYPGTNMAFPNKIQTIKYQGQQTFNSQKTMPVSNIDGVGLMAVGNINHPDNMNYDVNRPAVMEWNAFRDYKRDMPMLVPISNLNSHCAQNSFQAHNKFSPQIHNQNFEGVQSGAFPNKIMTANSQFNNIEENHISLGTQQGNGLVPVNMQNMGHSNHGTSYQVHHKKQTVQIPSNEGNLFHLPVLESPLNSNTQNLHKIDSQIADGLDPMIQDVRKNPNIEQQFSPREISAMIFNNNVNLADPILNTEMNQLRGSGFTNNFNTNHPQSNNHLRNSLSNQSFSNNHINQLQTNNLNSQNPYYNIQPQLTPITSYPLSHHETNNPHTVTEITQKRRVTTIDQGTGPVDEYFASPKRINSPLKSYKLREMEIQLSPEKKNFDRFPTVVQPRFSDVQFSKTQNYSLNGQLSRPIIPKIPESVQSMNPNQYGIVTNLYLKQTMNSFDSPAQTRNLGSYSSQETLPKVNLAGMFKMDERFQSPGRLIQNKTLNGKDFQVRVENGITVYSRKSNKVINDNDRTKSLSFSPRSPNDYQVSNTRVLNGSNYQNEYKTPIRTRQNVVVDLRTITNQPPQPPINNIITTKNNVIVDLRNDNYQLEGRGTRGMSYDSPRASNAGETYINSLISMSRPQVNGLPTHTQTFTKTSAVYHSLNLNPNVVPPVLEANSLLNVIYPHDQIDFQKNLKKRVQKINLLKYHNKQSLIQILRNSKGQVILVAGIPFDRNIQQLRKINPEMQIMVFKGNPNLIRMDEKTMFVNSQAELLAEIQRASLRK